MHRTQIYFDEALYTQVKQAAQRGDMSVSAYIRDALKRELEGKSSVNKALDFSQFAGLWQDEDISQQKLRAKAWK